MVQKINEKFSLTAISPIDGRYSFLTSPLRSYFSEFALIKFRVLVELTYLLYLSKRKLIRRLSRKEKILIEKLSSDFDLSDALEIKNIEKTTHHDIKAVEYFLRKRLQRTSLKDIVSFIHISLTSEDINNVCWRTLTLESLNDILLPQMLAIQKKLWKFSLLYKELPMLGRTHGQAAVPTTLGKEIAVFAQRLKGEIDSLKTIKFKAKFSGAVGSWNAFCLAFPSQNPESFSKGFLKSFGLGSNHFSTQIAPYEDLIGLVQNLQRINLILINLNQDIWRYISDGWLVLGIIPKRVGSSTMPQKVNPVEFENSEGNLLFANGTLEAIVSKVSVSRLQRDLSGSTVLRNLGVSFAHCRIGYSGILDGLEKISVDKKKIMEDLNIDWRILAEALQTLLRKEEIGGAFEKVSELTRKGVWTQDIWQEIVTASGLTETNKKKLLRLTPQTYIGLSAKIVK